MRGASSIGGDARWAFTMAKLKADTAAAHGIPEAERKRFRRLDSLKASYGADDEQTRLLKVESVTIANGESVGVLVEVDAERTRQAASERKASDREERQYKFGLALAQMVSSRGPSSLRATALWFQTHRPDLFVNPKGEPLGDTTIRTRLPGMIGAGIDLVHEGRPRRIVIRPTIGKRGAEEIAFDEPNLTGQWSDQ